jgi:anthranilate synthase component I
VIYPFAQFQTLAQQGNFIPVYQELVADLDTPVSAWYRVCAGQPYSFLLESVEGGEAIGRYSHLGCNPLWTLEPGNLHRRPVCGLSRLSRPV